jgi:uncharacterized membrane protein
VAALALALGATGASALDYTYAETIRPEGTPAGDPSVSTATNTTARTDPGNALGAPNGSFFSLGLGKYADFTFGAPFFGSGGGGGGIVYEITNGTVATFPEFVDVFVFDAGSTDIPGPSVATIRNTTAATGATFTFAGTWDTMRLLDVTARECAADTSLDCTRSLASGADGFDVDAVGVTVVPLPAAAWLLLGVSGALVAAKRRSSREAA